MPRKPETDEQGNTIPLAELERLPILERDEELHLAIAATAKLKAQIKALEADEEQLSTQVLDSIFARGQMDYLIPGQVKVVVQSRTSRTTDPAKLIAAGVDPDVVQAATTTTHSKPFLRLYPVKA